MRIQCTCGKFQAELKSFPRSTPGRLMCYCDDCQKYLIHLGRTDLLESSGGTEVIPVYPSDIAFVTGADQLKCVQLSPKGLFRWSTMCCNSPVGNARPGTPWFGVQRNMYLSQDPQLLERTFGGIKARIMGKFSKGPIPASTPEKMNLKAAIAVLPFMLKGAIGGKARLSPFFHKDGRTPIVAPVVLTADQLSRLHRQWENVKSY